MEQFELDAVDIIEGAGGELESAELYCALAARGHRWKAPTLRKHLKTLDSVQCVGQRWRLVEIKQGEGVCEDLTVRLGLPADANLDPPVGPRVSCLPVEQLSWEDFEQLCVHLLDRRCVQGTVQLYGLRGQNQLGIDVLGVNRESGVYEVIQCKRYQSAFGEAELSAAVTRFLEGRWRSDASVLILAVTQDMTDARMADAINEQRAQLKARGVDFEVWDTHRLTRMLMKEPHLVALFFGEAWRAAVTGENALPRVYMLDATGPLGDVLSDNSPKAFQLAVLQSRGCAVLPPRSADVDDVTTLDNPTEWEARRASITLRVQKEIELWRRDDQDAVIAVFPFARVSLLFCLGMTLGDQQNVSLYRWDRERHTWSWRTQDEDLALCIVAPEQTCRVRHVVVLICVTTDIFEPNIREFMERQYPGDSFDLWRLRAEHSRTYNNIHHPEQLVRFKRCWLELLAKLDEAYGVGFTLHLFISAAAPIVVAAGQALPTRSRPEHIHLHEHCRTGHHHVLSV